MTRTTDKEHTLLPPWMATTVKCVLRQYFEDFNKAAAALEKAKGKKREKKVAARLEYLARKEQRNHLLCFDINLHWPVWSFADISDRYQKDHIVCFNLAPDPKSGETRITTSKFEYVLGFQKISAEMPAIKLNEDITNVDPEAAAYLRAMLAEYLDEPAGAGDDPEAEAVEAKAAEDEAAEADQEEEEEAAVALEAQEDSSTEAESSTDMPDTDSDDDDMLKLLRLPFDWMGMMERGRAGTLSRGGPHGGPKRARERYVRTTNPKIDPSARRGPQRPQEAPKRPQETPKRPPGGPKRSPRGPQEAQQRPNRGPTEAPTQSTLPPRGARLPRYGGGMGRRPVRRSSALCNGTVSAEGQGGGSDGAGHCRPQAEGKRGEDVRQEALLEAPRDGRTHDKGDGSVLGFRRRRRG